MGLWYLRVQRKPCDKSLTSGARSSHTNVNPKPQTWRQGTGYVISLRSRIAANAEKTSILRSLLLGFVALEVRCWEWWEHSWLLFKVFCCSLVLSSFRRPRDKEEIRIGNVFDFVAVQLSTTSYLYSWVGLWTLNLLRLSLIYLVCTGFLSPHKEWRPWQDYLLSELCGHKRRMSEDSRKYYWLRNIVELAEENCKNELKRATNYVGEIAEKLEYAFGVRENMWHKQGSWGFSEPSEGRPVECIEEF